MRAGALILIGLIASACTGWTMPTADQVKNEFLLRNPHVEILSVKRTWEEVAVAVYRVEFKKVPGDTIEFKDIMLHECSYGEWKNDYRECGK
jgi:hypothetical protein